MLAASAAAVAAPAVPVSSVSAPAGADSSANAFYDAGAPVVNAVISLMMHPPKSAIPPQFILGIAMAAVGGCLVTFYKPKDPPKKKPGAAITVEGGGYAFDAVKYRPGRHD